MPKTYALYLVTSSDPGSSSRWSLPTHWLVHHIVCQHTNVCILHKHTHENTFTQKIVRNVVLTPEVRHTAVIGHKAWTEKQTVSQLFTCIWCFLALLLSIFPCLLLPDPPWPLSFPSWVPFPKHPIKSFLQSQNSLFHPKILFPLASHNKCYRPSGSDPS